MDRREPVRTCVACRQTSGKRELIRLHRTSDGTVAVDTTQKAPGRGAYLHADRGCIELAHKRRSLERALRAGVPKSVWEQLASWPLG
jgi:predicted RNA-binding protein YlxR (DUF448 family)